MPGWKKKNFYVIIRKFQQAETIDKEQRVEINQFYLRS